MNVSLTILTIFILLVMFGAGQRVLDNLRLTDRQALWIMLAIVVGILIPPIYIGEYFAFSIGGFLIPFALCVYLLVKVGWSRDLLRAMIGIILVAGAVIGIEWLIPAEPETMTIDPNFVFGLVAGLLAYIMGRSRRNAFISAVFGLTIAEVIQFFINQAKGTPTVLGLGVGGAFDAIIISALLAVALAEFIGRAYEKVKPGKEHKAYNFETGTYDSEKNGKLKKEEFVEGYVAGKEHKIAQEKHNARVTKHKTGQRKETQTKATKVMKTTAVLLCATLACGVLSVMQPQYVFAKEKVSVAPKYYTVYEQGKEDTVLFTKGEGVCVGDEYISGDNRLFEIVKVDETSKTGEAKFKENVKLPVYHVTRNTSKSSVNAGIQKIVGVYHTHNDESYTPSDGYDSIYGKGGIHDVGKTFNKNLNKLGIEVKYSENLHLPHNSGAYNRSEVTAKQLLNSAKLDAIFDLHRDATPKSTYQTTVNGEKMSKVRMVVGSANANKASNKEFALSIKSYADSVYPGLILDIYMGKGNYNQELSSRAMLFEMGCDKMEKELVEKSTIPLAKTIDMVLYGSANASSATQADVMSETGGKAEVVGLTQMNSTSTNETLWVVLGTIGVAAAIFGLLCINKNFRYQVQRFFKQLFPFKKKHAHE